ncbi:MAG: HAD-IC family P-type ATPase [bacterium]
MAESHKTWHYFSASKVLEVLKSHEKGLSFNEVKKRQKQHGYNVLPKKKPLSRLVLLLNQLRSPLVYVLLAAGAISIFLKHHTDAGVIFFVVSVNTFFGYWQEKKANSAIERLRDIIKDEARVMRDGNISLVKASDLVAGDIIMMQSGNKVPADARLIECHEFQTIESMLTGESAPVEKSTELSDKGAPLAERSSMVYMGTIVARGTAKAVVCGIGSKTEIGKISTLIGETKEQVTPLQLKLIKFSRQLTFLILTISLVIFIEGYFSGRDLVEMFLVVLALAVSAIPEGLLVAVTIILTLGMQFILKRKALVRRLTATETLGCTSVICTDKTGTLTEGVMRVSKIITADNEYEIEKNAELSESEKSRNLINKISILCSSAIVENPDAELEHIKIIGDPTESALLLASIQAGIDKHETDRDYQKLDELPFDSEKKYMATLHSHNREGHNHIFVKGAPERIFEMCERVLVGGKKAQLNKKKFEALKKKYESMTAKGLRVLAFAYKTGQFNHLQDEIKGLVFLGFVALKDPLRADAKDTMKLCQQAGIRPIIITGDHKLTAKAIFMELGIKVDGNIAEGKDLDKWSDDELDKKVKEIDIYARVEPKHKLRVISAWQRLGEVVAMTGDGINDAPAIKRADIGIAFGSGSDVAKETADIVLLDNSFGVIVSAVEQGRVIFENIRKVVLYLLADSFSEMILIAGSLILGLPLPILATQILWINLVGDGLPSIAMTLEPGERAVMDDKPRSKNEPILNKEMKILIFVIGVITDLILLALFVVLLKMFTDIDYIRTIIFTALGIDSLLYVFSVRSLRYSIFTKNPFSNKYLLAAVAVSVLAFIAVVYVPFLQGVFHTTNIGFMEWGVILALALFKIFLIETVKHFFISKKQKHVFV